MFLIAVSLELVIHEYVMELVIENVYKYKIYGVRKRIYGQR